MIASKTAAIVVAYYPDVPQLCSVLRSVQQQTAECFLVNNGSTPDLPALLAIHGVDMGRLTVIDMGDNCGTASAHNAGIAAARNSGATHVLLLDQDSIPAPDMVRRLVDALSMRPDAAAVGPCYEDARQQNPPPFIRIRGLRLERYSCASSDCIRPVDYLISSGCLIPMAVLEKVGGMRDGLFIDYVDIEWGLRARRHGLQSYGVCAARMQHALGDQPLEFFGRKIPLHSPLRHYYHFRNALLLYRESWVPWNWKVVDAWRLFLKYGFYSLFARPRMEHLRMMSLGVLHGLRGRSGKLGERETMVDVKV